MAATNYTPISLYYSTTASTAPTAGNLVNGELAINITDGVLYYKDNAGAVQKLATKGGVGTSTTTQVLYNSSGLVVGSANLTFNGTTLTTTNDASISGLTVGKGLNASTQSTAFGYQALSSQTDANGYNTVVGYQAAKSTTSGTEVNAFGRSALYSNTTGSEIVAIGDSSLFSNTTGGKLVAVGTSAMQNNTTGGNNTAIGYAALFNNTTASNNTAVGYQAGYSNTTAGGITLLGYKAGFSNTTGSGEQTFIGNNAGYSNTGAYNTFVGSYAGYYATTGTSNTFVGPSGVSAAGLNMTTGSKNSIFGAFTGNNGGLDIRTASNYIVLSDGDGNPRLNVDGSGNTFFGGRTSTGTTNTGCYISVTSGIFNTGRTNGGDVLRFFCTDNGNQVGQITVNTALTIYGTTSDYRLKTAIAPVSDASSRIDALEPVEYDFQNAGRTRGFLAHKFAEIYPNSVSGKKDAVDEEGKPIYQGMQAATSEVMADLIAEIQSLRKRVALLESK